MTNTVIGVTWSKGQIGFCSKSQELFEELFDLDSPWEDDHFCLLGHLVHRHHLSFHNFLQTTSYPSSNAWLKDIAYWWHQKRVKIKFELQMTFLYPLNQFQSNLIGMYLGDSLSKNFKDINSIQNYGYCGIRKGEDAIKSFLNLLVWSKIIQ